MKRDDQQISAYLNRQMSPDELAAFAGRLEHDEQLARKLARMSLVEVLLRDQLRFEAEPSLSDCGAPVVSRRQKFVRWLRERVATLNRPLVLSLSIATVVMGLLIAALAFIAMPHLVPRRAPSPLPAEIVARLVNFDNPVWAVGQIGTTRGAFLRSHQLLDLRAGLATIEFNDGARATIAGPTRLQLVSANAASLEGGRLLAHVPPAARGYQIRVGEVLVTDRGTRFSIAADDEFSSVEVFEGEVVVAAAGRGGAAPTMLQAGMAAKFSSSAQLVERRPSDERRFAPQAALLARRCQSSGQIRYLPAPPASLAPGALESNQVAHLVLEREGVTLARDVHALVVTSDAQGKARLTAGQLARGRRVDCYLVHMDIEDRRPEHTKDTHITCRGSIHFEQPVLAMIIAEDELTATDGELGAPHTTYASTAAERKNRGMELDTLDQLATSPDGRTVHVTCVHGVATTDQVRILVAAEAGDNRSSP